MERQGRYGTLVADVEDDMVVCSKTIMEPLDLRSHERRIAQGAHEITALGMDAAIMGIEMIAAGVGKGECSLIGAVEI